MGKLTSIGTRILILAAKIRYIHIDILAQKLRLKNRKKNNIVEIKKGNYEDSRTYAILVYYEPDGRLSESIKNIVKELTKNSVNVMLVCNHTLSEEQEEFFLRNCKELILRNNQGFDFGAYKDAISYIYESNVELDRLLLMNDSVYYSSNGLSSFVKELLKDIDAIAAYENWSLSEGHHLQSFCVSISNHVFQSKGFREFWKNYVPINNRIYAIENGEKKLSKAIAESARSSYVVYSVSKMYDKLKQEPVEKVGEILSFLPRPWRGAIDQEKYSKSAGYRVEVITNILNNTSPIHAGAFLFPYFLNSPLYKKDIVYRSRFPFWEVEYITSNLLQEREFCEYINALRKKGDSSELSFGDKIKFNVGVK
ncbi:rhamnan synthesis F family protein [Halomonas sp. ATCH28]|uniref:Rhamnan synthesis F family protein n=1 Tax=Halomonas gemina TaxID=2945105 RepID=A0ABT0SY79_9GAMM|nr:rhamnan synthesis F family protein [Halomonas gemina]MCL7939246.1 rhamnan synthesis F family protein [Halomonas gemina]